MKDKETPQPILVSACLLGRPCRYDGGHCLDPAVVEFCRRADVEGIPVCPEELGGLAVPRPPAEVRGDPPEGVWEGRARVITREGRDVTAAFKKGARRTLELARQRGARLALLKSRSPSCGSDGLYDGGFTRALRPGRGVTAALLTRHGVQVYSEEDLASLQALLAGQDPC